MLFNVRFDKGPLWRQCVQVSPVTRSLLPVGNSTIRFDKVPIVFRQQ